MPASAHCEALCLRRRRIWTALRQIRLLVRTGVVSESYRRHKGEEAVRTRQRLVDVCTSKNFRVQLFATFGHAVHCRSLPSAKAGPILDIVGKRRGTAVFLQPTVQIDRESNLEPPFVQRRFQLNEVEVTGVIGCLKSRSSCGRSAI